MRPRPSPRRSGFCVLAAGAKKKGHPFQPEIFMKLFLPLLLLLGFNALAADPLPDANRIWEEVDVVPMPRQLVLTGAKPVLDPSAFVLVTGDSATRQSEIGAAWLNKRIVASGGTALKIIKASEEIPSSLTPIIIGTKEDNALIAKAVEDGVVNVGEKNPGVRGYEIRKRPDGAVLLAGADSIGALYACVTVGEMLEARPDGPPAWQEAGIRDWPDIQYVYVLDMEPPSDVIKDPDSPSARKSYLDKLSRMYDNMLRRKLSIVWYKPLAWGETAFRDMSPYTRETMRMGIEAAKEMGIESLYYHLYPFVGLRKDHPNVDPDLLEKTPKARYDTWLQSWSMDDERRLYAQELARWIKEVGFTDVGFHDTDTGGYVNPANWNSRGPVDQKRWGDDYAAATVNKFRIFFDEMMKENPSLRVNLTLYPYTSEIFDPSEQVQEGLRKTLSLDKETMDKYRKRYASFWTQMNEAFPKKDVAFAIREPWSANGEPGLRAFLALIHGRPLFAWYGLAAAEFYCNVPSWLGSLHSGSVDDIVFTQNIYVDRGYVPILSLAMREYSWNTKAPGATSFKTRDRAKMSESAAGDTTTESYTVVLPHVVRNYFGRTLAPDITTAIQQNASPFIVFGGRPDRNIVDETELRMSTEVGRAKVATESMDAAWAKLEGTKNVLKLEPDVLARVAYLRQVFHATLFVARIKEAVYRSQKLSSLNRFDEAQQTIEEGLAQLAAGKAELAALQNEGPAAVGGQMCSAQATLDKMVPMLGDMLNQRKEAIAAAQKSGGIPSRVLDILAAETSLPIVAGTEPIKIDGEVNDAAWAKAYPAEAWFLAGSERLVADTETRFLTLTDKDSLYVAFKCWTTPGADVGLKAEDREFVRIYFNRSDKNRGSLLGFAIWANGKIESNDKNLIAAVQGKVTHAKGMWQGELRIPLATLGTREGCRIGFIRSYNRFGVSHISSIVPLDSSIAGPFEDARPQLAKFPVAKWDEAAFKGTARLRILDAKVREVTLDDRIATIVDFGLTADSDCVLDNVVVKVEALNADGVVESQQEILSDPSLKYQLKQKDGLRATFLQAVTKGSIRVTLNSDQAQAEATYRFGK